MKPASRASGRGAGSAISIRHHQQQQQQPGRLTPAVVLACVVALGIVLWNVVQLQAQAHQHASGAARHLAPLLPSDAELYGLPAPGLRPGGGAAVSGAPSQLLVLGYYGSQASLVARLLMLMGVWAGDATQLHIDTSNRLRWWELQQLSTLNDLMLQKYAAPGLPPHLGRGFHASHLSAEDSEYYADRARGIIRYLNTRRPWLIKDPRMAWLAPLWLERLDAPLCVLVADMRPERLAVHLSAHPQQPLQRRRPAPEGGGDGGESGGGGALDVSSTTHLERWTNATLSSIKACLAVPTIVVPSSVLRPPLLKPFLAVLQQHLKLAGVQGTRLPQEELLHQQYLAHLHATGSPSGSTGFCGGGSSAAGAANSSASANLDGAALLQEACNWLPPKPGSGAAGGDDGGGDGPGPDARALPVPTRALLEALHDHLAAHLAHPGPQLQYSRVAGQLFAQYTRRVKQLVADGGGAHHHHHGAGEHHGLAALVLDALKHAEATVAAGGARQLRSRRAAPLQRADSAVRA